MLPVVLAVAGFAVVVAGISQGLIHVAPGYEGQIMSGWGGPLNHEEILLAQLGGIGIAGSVAARRWKRLSLIPVAMGGVVLFYAVRALGLTMLDTPLYTETTTTYGGEPIMFVLGAEPFLLIAGGSLLVGAGVLGWRAHADRENGMEPTDPSPAV
jgi:hypothetical protein